MWDKQQKNRSDSFHEKLLPTHIIKVHYEKFIV